MNVWMNEWLNAAFDESKGEAYSSYFLLEASDRGKRQRNEEGEHELDTCQRQVSPFLWSFFWVEEKQSETFYQAGPKKINKLSVP